MWISSFQQPTGVGGSVLGRTELIKSVLFIIIAPFQTAHFSNESQLMENEQLKWNYSLSDNPSLISTTVWLEKESSNEETLEWVTIIN